MPGLSGGKERIKTRLGRKKLTSDIAYYTFRETLQKVYHLLVISTVNCARTPSYSLRLPGNFEFGRIPNQRSRPCPARLRDFPDSVLFCSPCCVCLRCIRRVPRTRRYGRPAPSSGTTRRGPRRQNSAKIFSSISSLCGTYPTGISWMRVTCTCGPTCESPVFRQTPPP